MEQLSFDGQRRVTSFSSTSTGSRRFLRASEASTSPAKLSTIGSEAIGPTPIASPTLPLPAPSPKTKQGAKPLVVYRSVSWMLGFRERWSFLLFFIFGGALLGFCLARSESMDPRKIKSMTVAGEFYWFDRSLYKVNYFIHNYMSILGGIFVGLQFVPSIRRSNVLLHRVNGYICLFLIIASNICGCIVAYRSFGGGIDVQCAYYLMALMSSVSGFIGLYNVKRQTRRHRKWMMRMVVYFSVVITARLIALAAREIVSRIGSHYAVWRCGEMAYVVGLTTARELYTQCFSGDGSILGGHSSIAVHASTFSGSKLELASAARATQGMALWSALVIHIIGIELYLQKTEEANHSRYGYVLEPKDYDGEGQELWEYRY